MNRKTEKWSGFEAIDWDLDDDEDGNLAHCLRRGVDEVVVEEVLRESPVEIKMKLQSADFAVVGPDRSGTMWTILFDTSFSGYVRSLVGLETD